MKKQENIYVALQIVRDDDSRELTLSIQFDRNAPNFSADKNTISWCPTAEELYFVSEAFGVFTRGKPHRNDQTGESVHEDTVPYELSRDADEKAILDRVLEKKRPNY